jgi:phosphatidylinositol alpha-mannosyltransferase
VAPVRVVLSIYDDVDNPHYGGGGAVVVGRLARQLSRDHAVTVYTGSYRGSGRSRVRDGVRYVFLPVGWCGPRAGQVLFTLLVPLVALVVRPRVWIESLTPPFSASLLPVVSRAPVVAFVQMLAGADMQQRYGLPFAAIERRGLALYRHFVVLNEADERAVRAASPHAEVTVIPNGVDLPDVDEDGFGHGDYIAFLGRIDVRQKGLDLLLEAVLPDLPLPVVIAGAGTEQEEARLRALIPASARDRIRLAGRVDGARKDELLRGCAFVVTPSRYETFCLSALEAMAYGKPVVHFDLERLSWIGADAALAVPAFDVDALRDAIARLAADVTLRARLGRAGRARSTAYGWDAVGERHRELVAALTG